MLKSMPIKNIEDELLLKYNIENLKIEELREIYIPKPFKEGLFIDVCLNFEHNAAENIDCISDLMFYVKNNHIIETRSFKDLDLKTHMNLIEKSDTNLDSYGVCDNFEQVLKLYNLEELDGNFTISFTPVHKKHQPKDGGWRWHKWGKYIGTQKSEAEYIYDEPNIDLLYIYHILKWSEKNKKDEKC